MYQSPNSTTTTTTTTTATTKSNDFNNGANGFLASNETTFPKFDEFNDFINSEEFLDSQFCKQKSPQEQQQFFNEQQQQQVNLFDALESLSENNNNNNNNNNTTSVNIVKSTTEQRISGNIGLPNYFIHQPTTRNEQETLLTPQVQLYDNNEGRRFQYFDQNQLMKESIYQETKSFFFDIYNYPTDETNMANNISTGNQQHQQQQLLRDMNSDLNDRDNYDNMTRQERPYVEIVEQPAKCSLRFRYKCEGRSAGSLPGVYSSADNKSYPSMKIRNYTGQAAVVISCVTKDAPYLAHPHNIVGKEGCKKGICTVKVNCDPNTVRSFPSLGIQCVKRKDIEESLTEREKIRVDPFSNGFAHKLSSSNIDLNVVRLCFQVFIVGSTPNRCDIPLTPVVSDPIHDKKAMSDLVITKLSHCTAPASGGREIILLCDRISRDDIQIRFYEERDGKLIWETYTELAPTDVHKQVAICFKTPKYFNENISQPVSANIQLKRLSDNQVSEPRTFKFLPCESDEDMMSRKRQKMHQVTQNLQHNHHHYNQHQNHHHQQQQQHLQHQQAACSIPQPQSHLHPQPSIIKQQQQSPRVVAHAPDSPFQQHPLGRSSASPHSRIASPVTPNQANSPAAMLDRRIQQGQSPSPSAANHHNQANQPLHDQDTYVIERLQQQQQHPVVRGEIIAIDGKVVRLVDRPSQHRPTQTKGSDARTGHEMTNQQQQQRNHEVDSKTPLGLSLARIDSDQLMRADMAFNPNMNLDLGSSISIHLNGAGNGNGTTNNNYTATPIP